MDDIEDLRRAVAARNGNSALKRAAQERKLQEKPLEEMAGGGLARIAKHMNRPFAMISAFQQKEGRTPRENLEATAELAQRLNSMRIGALAMNGNYGSPEKSFFVPKPPHMDFHTFLYLMEDLGHEFDQDSVGVSDGTIFSLHYMDGGSDEIGDVATMRPDAVQDMWSEIKRKKFVIVPKSSGSHIDHTKLKD